MYVHVCKKYRLSIRLSYMRLHLNNMNTFHDLYVGGQMKERDNSNNRFLFADDDDDADDAGYAGFNKKYEQFHVYMCLCMCVYI